MKTILVVDDSPTARFDIRNKLHDLDPEAELFIMSGYDEAKAVLESRSVDLAIIDLQMPVKNGADLIVHMKSVDAMKKIPIIVMTGTGEDSLLRTSIEPKVNYYLNKPIGKELLKNVLEELRHG